MESRLWKRQNQQTEMNQGYKTTGFGPEEPEEYPQQRSPPMGVPAQFRGAGPFAVPATHGSSMPHQGRVPPHFHGHHFNEGYMTRRPTLDPRDDFDQRAVKRSQKAFSYRKHLDSHPFR